MNFRIKTPFVPSVEIREHLTNRLELNLTKENSGQYACSAWNSNGRVEKSIRVNYYGECSTNSAKGQTNR